MITTELMYRGTFSNGAADVLEGTLHECVYALAEVADIDPQQCTTKQVPAGDDVAWLVYSDHERLDDDTDGMQWFARVTLESQS